MLLADIGEMSQSMIKEIEHIQYSRICCRLQVVRMHLVFQDSNPIFRKYVCWKIGVGKSGLEQFLC